MHRGPGVNTLTFTGRFGLALLPRIPRAAPEAEAEKSRNNFGIRPRLIPHVRMSYPAWRLLFFDGASYRRNVLPRLGPRYGLSHRRCRTARDLHRLGRRGARLTTTAERLPVLLLYTRRCGNDNVTVCFDTMGPSREPEVRGMSLGVATGRTEYWQSPARR